MSIEQRTPPPWPTADGGARAHPYTRFIPREELSAFAAWPIGDVSPSVDRRSTPDRRAPPGTGATATDGAAIWRNLGSARAEAAAADPAELLAQQLRAARQSGYQDGYRDGLVALEGFKQSFAAQTTSQVGTLVASIGGALDSLQQQMALSVARAAAELARRIVRNELAARPETIALVAQEAIDALLLSARHIALRVHPDDAALVAAGAGEALSARGARIVADAAISRGGCTIESDIGGVDARIEERWRQVTASIGSDAPWRAGEPPVAPAETVESHEAAAPVVQAGTVILSEASPVMPSEAKDPDGA